MKVLSKYNWFHGQNFSVCGYLLQGSRLIEGEELEKYFAKSKGIKEFEESVKNVNGRFAVVGKIGDDLIAAVDKLRTYPLFYSQTGYNIVISDSDSVSNFSFAQIFLG